MAAVAIAVDLATKAWATTALADRGIDLPGPLDLRLAYNRGVAFGLFDGAPPVLMIALTGALTVVLGLMAWRAAIPAVPAGLMLGGAVANLLDRLIGGSVVDVLHTGWWPTFNLADSFITVGAGLLALLSLRPERDEQATVPGHRRPAHR
ncbi:MAG: signal peptidase II [Acidimicrobiia bacterium]